MYSYIYIWLQCRCTDFLCSRSVCTLCCSWSMWELEEGVDRRSKLLHHLLGDHLGPPLPQATYTAVYSLIIYLSFVLVPLTIYSVICISLFKSKLKQNLAFFWSHNMCFLCMEFNYMSLVFTKANINIAIGNILFFNTFF